MQTRFLLALFLLVAAAPLHAQEADSRKTARIAEAEKILATAETELEAANLAIQDLYATFAATYRRAGAGQDPETQDDLERVFEPALTAAIEAARDRGTSRRVRSAFDRKLGRAGSLAETPFVKAMLPHIRGVASERMEQIGIKVTDLTVSAFVSEISSALFDPEREFALVWNESIAERCPETKRYVEARADVKKRREQLMVLRDPKLRFTVDAPAGMARIPAQNVRVEAKYGFTVKSRRSKVGAFFIDLKEVTHGEYWNNFHAKLSDSAEQAQHLPVNADGAPQWFQDPTTGAFRPSEELLNLPVTGIDATSAVAYAEFLGKRLPTDAEWVAAASGDPKQAFEYSFGKEFLSSLCNSKESGHKAPLPAGELAGGRSFYGLYHTCGNVKEWTATTSEGRDLKPKKGFEDGDSAVIRGGSFKEAAPNVSLKWRWVLPIRSKLMDVGFRCAQDVL
jgi:formylglycine-generating enzyme required for sulfatase activity